MVNTGLLFLFLTMAVVTDVRENKIYNWTTYPGILVAFVAATVAWLVPPEQFFSSPQVAHYWIGFPPHNEYGVDSTVLGFFACGAIMVVCFVLFRGGVGGGDVKLVAMMGAFFGLYRGLEAMIWTFVLAAVATLLLLIWRVGPIGMSIYAWEKFKAIFRLGGESQLTDEEKKQFKNRLYIAPSAMAAAFIVTLNLDRFLML